jgi:hypothetical protein
VLLERGAFGDELEKLRADARVAAVAVHEAREAALQHGRLLGTLGSVASLADHKKLGELRRKVAEAAAALEASKSEIRDLAGGDAA